MKLVDKIKVFFKRIHPRKIRVVGPEKKRKEGGVKDVKDLQKQGLNRGPALKKNNVGCQYVYTDW